jgi:tRNA-Thr(GGU) m(6)t(6)A37 methyltransferase TsaA
MMKIEFHPIGVVRTESQTIPRHWSVSDVEGWLEIDPAFISGLKDMVPEERILVFFVFHQSPPFTKELLIQTPPHRREPRGVFSTCSPVRPNPLGMSVVRVLSVDGSRIHVKGLDMRDGTPIVDLKPFVGLEAAVPSGA